MIPVETEAVDVLVIGGGPAGAICATALKQADDRNQRRVTLVEREVFPRYKVCGCCLNGAAESVLDSVGLGRLLSDIGAVRLTDWKASFGDRRVQAVLPSGWAVSREKFDSVLLTNARNCGVEVLQPVEAKVREVTESGVLVELTKANSARKTCKAQVVVLATGLGGAAVDSFLPWKQFPEGPIGAGGIVVKPSSFYQPGTIYMACADGGYAGAVVLEDGRLDVAAAIYRPSGTERKAGERKFSLGDRISRILNAAGMPGIFDSDNNFEDSESFFWKGTPALHRQRLVGRGPLIAIGDAAGYVEPFTGEGMAWAMHTGKIAADCIKEFIWENNCSCNTLGERYEIRYKQRLGSRRWPCRMVTQSLQHHWGRQIIFGALTQFPWLARPVIRQINRPAVTFTTKKG